MLAPIIIFVFRRPKATKLVIEALLKSKLADKSDVFIYSDCPKTNEDKEKVDNVRKYIKTIKGFKSITIIERTKNFGLSKNYCNGVKDILKHYDRFIVVEDDVLTHPYFLEYINSALNKYENTKNVFSISGYSPPPCAFPIPKHYNKEKVYFNPIMICWGFATWKDRWEKADFESNFSDIVDLKKIKKVLKLPFWGTLFKNVIEGKVVDSWATIFFYFQHIENGLCLCPIKSLVNSIGFDNDGTHGLNPKSTILVNDLNYKISEPFYLPDKPFTDKKLTKKYTSYYRRPFHWKLYSKLYPLISKLYIAKLLIKVTKRAIIKVYNLLNINVPEYLKY